MSQCFPPSAAIVETLADTVAGTVVVEDLVHDGGIVVFRARGQRGTAARFVAPRSVVGRAPTPGETWRVEGKTESHPTHGRQVTLASAALVHPSGRLLVSAIARSATFPGIGTVTAQRLWDAHGEELFALLNAGDPEAFVGLVGSELATVLVRGWRALDDAARSYRWLTQHGFPVSLGHKLVAIYGQVPVPPEATEEARAKGRVVWHLEADPYRMLAFASWSRTDAVARRLGIADDDERRLTGVVEAALAQQLSHSHTWVAVPDLVAAVTRLLGRGQGLAQRAVQVAQARRAVVTHQGGVQLPGCYAMERFVAERTEEIATGRYLAPQPRLARAYTRQDIERVLDAFERDEGYPLNPEQRAGVWMALTEPFSLLLGGPGVGKTTVLKAVHVAAQHAMRTVHQAALSGRAAQRIAEATGRPATTIAALLLRIDKGEVNLDDEPLLVLDESSMVDLATLYRLFRRCPPGTRFLLVGDPGQLPPVGFGLTFHVFTAEAILPRTELERVMRQTDASGIPAVCKAIRVGRVPTLSPPDRTTRTGVGFIDVPPAEITDTIIDLLERLGGIGAAQVVGAIKRGAGGVLEVNARLQRLMGARRSQLHGRFYAGDPVIATRNDYDLGVMNGELGVALENADAGALRCRFDTGEKVVSAAGLDDLDLAYAITCHKAQGSQFRRVIIPITPSRLLDRTLLLTAVSRAQEQAVLVGDRAAFEAAVVAPPEPSRRFVGLGR